jgi:hypothetical protein
MASLSYHSNPFELIRPGINGLKQNATPFVLTILAFFGVFAAVFLLGALTFMTVPALSFVVILVAIIASISYLILPFYRLTLASAKQQPMIFKAALAPDVALSWKLFGTQLLVGVLILLGLVALVIPGLILIGWYAYVPYVVLEEGLTGWAALKRSRELVRGHLVESWGTLGISSATNIFGLIPFVGPFLSVIAGLLLIPVVALRYLELGALKSDLTGDVAKPAVSGWNYAVIVLAIIGGSVSSYHSYTVSHTQNTTIQYNNSY